MEQFNGTFFDFLLDRDRQFSRHNRVMEQFNGTFFDLDIACFIVIQNRSHSFFHKSQIHLMVSTSINFFDISILL
jgi:hypothetical protein